MSGMDEEWEDPWGDFVGDTDDGGSQDDYYDPPVDEGESDPEDRDSDVITEPDDYSDTVLDWNEGSGTDDFGADLKLADQILRASGAALDVIGQVVKASGSPEAARALAAISVLPKVTGSFIEFAEKQVSKQKQANDYDELPVTVPTSGRKEKDPDALELVRRAIANQED